MPVASCIPFPFFAPCNDMLTMLACATRWLFFASLHACLHVHAWVLLASVSSMLQHNEVMDIRSKPTFCPLWTTSLFAFLLVCFLSCMLACLFAFLLSYSFVYLCLFSCFFACHVYHAYLFYASFTCFPHLFLPLLVCWFLVLVFACTHMEQGRMELGHDFPGTSKKGEDASM